MESCIFIPEESTIGIASTSGPLAKRVSDSETGESGSEPQLGLPKHSPVFPLFVSFGVIRGCSLFQHFRFSALLRFAPVGSRPTPSTSPWALRYRAGVVIFVVPHLDLSRPCSLLFPSLPVFPPTPAM